MWLLIYTIIILILNSEISCLWWNVIFHKDDNVNGLILFKRFCKNKY